jgi:hypothetical protein
MYVSESQKFIINALSPGIDIEYVEFTTEIALVTSSGLTIQFRTFSHLEKLMDTYHRL